ncbi:hypothetical protein, partial [Megasphaera massiliensis]|uniref:hypothetical protein n=1 Tax=Megasphaera massiliensis TaxID=1232428 RepID=UPI004027B3F2
EAADSAKKHFDNEVLLFLSLTPERSFGVGGGVSKQLSLTDAVGDKSDEILPMWQLLRRVPKGATRLSKSYRCGIFRD